MGFYRNTLPHLIFSNYLFIWHIRYILIILHSKKLIIFYLDVNILASTIVDQMKSAAFMAFSFIIFLHVLLVLFLSLCIWFFFLFFLVKFCKLLIIIVMFIYCYSCVCSVLYILFSSCQLALLGYPHWGFSVLIPQL